MFFSNYYIYHSNNLIINSIQSYKNIRDEFIIKFILKKKNNYLNNNKKLYEDALAYSKYYLYWKIYSCSYDKNIMDILFDIEYFE